MSLVRPKRSPIIGTIMVADVVLKSHGEDMGQIDVKDDILKLCRASLPRHKVPAAISIVPNLPIAATGKQARRAG